VQRRIGQDDRAAWRITNGIVAVVGNVIARNRPRKPTNEQGAYVAFGRGEEGQGSRRSSDPPRFADRNNVAPRQTLKQSGEETPPFLNSQLNDAMGYLVFDERDKSDSHLLLMQVGQYFIKTQNGRTRSMLIIPEPFFVHSGLTSLVQLADIIAYVVSWGVRLPHMTEPGRPELADLAKHVLRLQVATARRLLRNSPLTTARQSL
jgi:hypothetical protein